MRGSVLILYCIALVGLFGLGSCVDKSALQQQASMRCQQAAVALQVLGSGGPVPDDDRASSGYLVWIQGKARVMIDVGGGVILRFAQSGAKIEDLDVLAVTHLHADHVADLPDLIKGGFFSPRQDELIFAGPDGNDRFPATDAFLQGLLDPQSGVFRYLSPNLTGESAYFKITPRVLSSQGTQPERVFSNDRLTLDAIGIRHGDIPSVGYLVTVGQFKIAFTGDQSAQSTDFVTLAKDADLLIAHHAIPEGLTNIEALHRRPSQLGELAADADVRHMVLSHNMKRALDFLDDSFRLIRERYNGKLDVADDLSCYVLQ